MSVAATIKQQIGFWALAEVGARGFMQDDVSLYFDAKPLARIVRVKVWLTPADTYTVQVFHKRTKSRIHIRRRHGRHARKITSSHKLLQRTRKVTKLRKRDLLTNR